MITIRRRSVRKPLATGKPQTIGCGVNIAINNGEPSAIVTVESHTVYFTIELLDRLVKACNEYQRETAHRGHPIGSNPL